MKDLYFEEHVATLKHDLQVDPIVKSGGEARELVKLHGNVKITNGGYIHNDNLNTIAVINKTQIMTLAHEMRHAWQYQNQQEGFNFEPSKSTLRAVLSYVLGKKELDANQYACHYCWCMGLKMQAFISLLRVGVTWYFRAMVLLVPPSVFSIICNLFMS